MKVEYDDENGPKGLSKIKVRWRSDKSKLKVEDNDGNGAL